MSHHVKRYVQIPAIRGDRSHRVAESMLKKINFISLDSEGERLYICNMEQNFEILKTNNTGNIYKDAQNIIEQARKYAYQAIDIAMVQRNWLLGKRIADEELQGGNRAEYGKEIIKGLADYLTNMYGKGFTKSNLYQFVQFYKFFPNIFHAASGKLRILSWTHYRNLY